MPENKDPMDHKPKSKIDMPFLDHVEELRWRLIKVIASVAAMSIVSFAFADHIFKFVIMPLGDTKLYFTEITGSFYAYLKISFYTGVFAASPIVLYQLWRFIGPGLYDTEKKFVLPLVFSSSVLFLGGAAFCFFVVIPFALRFLIGYGEGIFTPIITISNYISFVGLLLIAFGVAFQLPVVGYFLGRIGIATPQRLSRGRPYALIIILIGAAIITPPDVFTQLLLAGPLYLLYEITIFIVKITAAKND